MGYATISSIASSTASDRLILIRFARMIGREEFDDAIDYLRAGLKGNKSDLASIEMIAHCHHWAGRKEETIVVCREALGLDPNSFDMHVMLSQLFAENGEHDDAAIHARKGLECYPEPLPEIPGFMLSAFNALGRFVPSIRNFPPDAALQKIETWRAEWFGWAKRYLSWYEVTFGETAKPTEH